MTAARTPPKIGVVRARSTALLLLALSGGGCAGPAATGLYTHIPGAASPYTNSLGRGQRFFRLIGN